MIILTDLTVKGFIEELASDSPAPGGGSVAALAAAIGAALSAMVFNLTVGKKAFAALSTAVQEQILTAQQEATQLQQHLTTLVDKDTEAFMTLMAAYQLPKETDGDKKQRNEKIQEAYKLAVAVPLSVATAAEKMYDCVLLACRYGNRNAISDAGVAALSTQTALEAALFNVMINLSGINDGEYTTKLRQQCAALVASGRQKQQEALAIVHAEIGIDW